MARGVCHSKKNKVKSLRRLIGGPKILENSFNTQSDPRLMLSVRERCPSNTNSPLYPFKFFVYFHERLLQMRAIANAASNDDDDDDDEGAPDQKALPGLKATVVYQIRTVMDSPESLGRLFAGLLETHTEGEKTLALFCGGITVCGFRGAFASRPNMPFLVNDILDGKFTVDLVPTRSDILKCAGVKYFAKAMRMGEPSLPDSNALPLSANPDFGLWLRQHGVTSRTFLEEAVRPPDWSDTPAVVVEVRSGGGGAVFKLNGDGGVKVAGALDNVFVAGFRVSKKDAPRFLAVGDNVLLSVRICILLLHLSVNHKTDKIIGGAYRRLPRRMRLPEGGAGGDDADGGAGDGLRGARRPDLHL